MFSRVLSITGRAGKAGDRRVGRWLIPCALLIFPVAGHAASYLDAIQVEAEKLGGGTASKQGAPAATAAERLALFERELEDSQRGSYLFYAKLSKENRDAVFREYEGGASPEDLRKSIMARFLRDR